MPGIVIGINTLNKLGVFRIAADDEQTFENQKEQKKYKLVIVTAASGW